MNLIGANVQLDHFLLKLKTCMAQIQTVHKNRIKSQSPPSNLVPFSRSNRC